MLCCRNAHLGCCRKAQTIRRPRDFETLRRVRSAIQIERLRELIKKLRNSMIQPSEIGEQGSPGHFAFAAIDEFTAVYRQKCVQHDVSVFDGSARSVR